ncbi:hypothetical protein [Haloarcula brevis]|uniref:hypothetical protein n=1 Tax=Haloarcula brevis TaxID=3111453 RepID=UPI00300F6531
MNLREIELLVRRYGSIPVAVLCLAALYVFISIGYRSVLGPILGATLGGIAAVIVLHIIQPEKERSSFTPVDYRISIIVTSLYVVAILVIYRLTIYERPISHYIVFGGFAGYIAYEIATGARKIRVVPQLLILTFFTYWSTQLAFPAGMYQVDTREKYLPLIQDALTYGRIEGQIPYLGHLAFVTENTIITGLSPRIGYFILATLILTGTLLIISILDQVFSAISSRVALYGALFFGAMGWTLGRGLHPGKLSFFYALTLLLGIVVIKQYVSPKKSQIRWTVLGLIVGPALIFGHRYSSGAALIFIVAIAAFILCYRIIPSSNHQKYRHIPALSFVAAYGITIVGTIHSGPLLNRLTGLLTSVLFPTATGSGGGPGRYSELSIELLLASTAGEAILFGLGILGAAIALRQISWEYDLITFWMGCLSVFLLISLVFNAADTQPQRFYSLLGLFGLNVFAGVTLVYLVRSDISLVNPKTVGMLVFAFAVLSLASPIAGLHLSIIGDEVPHSRYYNTSQLTSGDEWVNTYTGNSKSTLQTIPPTTELPYQLASDTKAVVDTIQIRHGDKYVYTNTAATTGVINSGGRGLGDRQFVFLHHNQNHHDNKIYSNNETEIFVKQ